MKQGLRQVASGTASIPAKSTVALATVTRRTGEVVSMFGFAPEPGVPFGADVPDGVFLYLESTGTPNQFALKGMNRHKDLARIVEWCVTGVVPA